MYVLKDRRRMSDLAREIERLIAQGEQWLAQFEKGRMK